MNLLYFGDRHYSETIPANRVDDFFLNTALKDQEIKEIGKQYNVKAFLHPGDLLERSKISMRFAKEIAGFWTNCDLSLPEDANLIKDKQIDGNIFKTINSFTPLIGVYGNHDLIGGDIGSVDNTIIGLLSSIGIFNMVSKENPYILYTEDGKKVAITGTSYHIGMDQDRFIKDYIVEEKLGDYHIHIVHGMLIEKSVGTLYRHTTLDQIKDTKADLTLCGHDHLGFGVIEHEGKIFANIGAVVRQKNDKRELKRIPSVLLISIDEKGLAVKEIPLKSAKPGEVVLSREKVELRKEKQKALEKFKEQTESLDILKGVDVKEILEDVAANEKIDEEIKLSILNRIKEKENQDQKVVKAKKDLFISKVILENFQSHKYTELDLSKGFNVLIGESRQGKSAVIRAIRWVFENKVPGKAKSFIRKGEDFARVSFTLSDETIISRYIESKRSGKNTYKIIYPDGTISEGNTKLLEEIQEVLGFNDFIIDKDLQVPLNILKQGDSWFLIGNDYTSTDRAKIIGALSGTHHADAAMRDIDSEKNKLSSEAKSYEKEMIAIHKNLSNYDYLEDIEKIIKESEEVLKEIESLQMKKNQIAKEYQFYKDFKYNIDLQDRIIKQTSDISLIKQTFNEVLNTQNKLNEIAFVKDAYKLHLDKWHNVSHYINLTNEINSVKFAYRDVFDQNKQSESIHKALNDYINQKNQLAKEEEIIKETQNINTLRELISKSKVDESSLVEVQKIYESYILENKKMVTILKFLKLSENIDQVKTSFNDITSFKTAYETTEASLIEYRKAKQKLDPVSEILKASESVELQKERLKDLQETKQTYEQIAVIQSELLEINKQKKKQDEAILSLSKSIDHQIDLYKELLTKEGVCPTCYGTLDRAIINRIIDNLKPKEA